MKSSLLYMLLCSPLQKDPSCMTKHGVTHCWERIAKDWDPRPEPSDWSRDYYYKPPAYGTYPLEKRD